jgi:hypothetical protein
MATKKRKKKGTMGRRRRRRVSGIHPALKQTGMMLLGAGVGAIIGAFGNQAIKTSFTTMPSYIGGATMVAGGAAVLMFAPPSPVVTGVACGLMGAGAIFATNETFLSLPGISGMPMGLTNANPNGPGYLQRTVGGYRNIPPNRIGGNLSGNGSRVIGQVARMGGMAGIYRN